MTTGADDYWAHHDYNADTHATTTCVDELWAQHIRDAKSRTRKCYEESRNDDNDDALMWFALGESETRPTHLATAIQLLASGPPDVYAPSTDGIPDARVYVQYRGVVQREYVDVTIVTEADPDCCDYVCIAIKKAADATECENCVSWSRHDVELLRQVHTAAVAKPWDVHTTPAPVSAKCLMDRYTSAFTAVINGEFAPARYPSEWVLPMGRIVDTWAWMRVDGRDFVSMNGTDLSNDTHIVAAMRALRELYVKRGA